MGISAYKAKRWLVAPRTAFRRRREQDLDPFSRSILEAQYYRPTMYRFIGATVAQPDLLFDADLGDGAVVVDGGAYVGDWARQMAERHLCRIVAFEPGPEPRRRATEALRDHDAVVLPFALGAEDATRAFALEGPGSVLSAASGTFGNVDVEMRDVAEAFRELHLDTIDLMKLNIEGGEYDVLDRLYATGWFGRIGYVSVQFHEWHPDAYRRRRRIRRRLRETHDEVWNYPWVWELWRRRDDAPRN